MYNLITIPALLSSFNQKARTKKPVIWNVSDTSPPTNQLPKRGYSRKLSRISQKPALNTSSFCRPISTGDN